MNTKTYFSLAVFINCNVYVNYLESYYGGFMMIVVKEKDNTIPRGKWFRLGGLLSGWSQCSR